MSKRQCLWSQKKEDLGQLWFLEIRVHIIMLLLEGILSASTTRSADKRILLRVLDVPVPLYNVTLTEHRVGKGCGSYGSCTYLLVGGRYTFVL